MEKKVILVCGLSGSGKSTLVAKLAERFRLKAVYSSGVLRAMREEAMNEIKNGKTTHNRGWWETDDAKKYINERLNDLSIDKELDKNLQKIINEGNVVMDSWTMPWLSKKGLKIWLKVSDRERAKRIALRDKMSEAEALKRAKEKEDKTIQIYKKLYGFEFGEDLEPFDVVLSNDELTEEETADIIGHIIEVFYKN